ncbi:beta strand repeat-containing protein [Flavobacterium wongokense]|uniref:beta strand repeat-containing protein n=1 Tax=Flavobacterium wongokense TaxID=2910674 RepID=UPI001F346317|nr:hypothetical protein [Flavobacterium sp. WG47]MCF6132828.1 hypothetical protein [Flavobacterium sp. WG47]
MKTTYLFTIAALLAITFSSNAQTDNIFLGDNAGTENTGSFSLGIGKNALSENSGNSNIGIGIGVQSFSSGGFNCALGNGSLASNREGQLNSAYGTRTLVNNITGSRNIAFGHRTLEANVDGSNNTAVGYGSLLFNVGSSNVSIGSATPRNLLTGDSNIFLGTESAINLQHASNNVFIGNRVAVDRNPSTPFFAGNDTNKSIIIADGTGDQRIFIGRTGNMGIGLGNNIIPSNKLDVKGGVVIGKSFTPNGSAPGAIAPNSGLLVEGNVGIGTSSPHNRLEVASGANGSSGLRFTNLTSSFNNVTVQQGNKFLSVNANGDVVLQKVSNAVETNTLTSNANIMTSNVNDIIDTANIVNSISNTITPSRQLITTVNGVASAPVTLPSQIQTISQSGNTVTLSQGGGSIVLPTFNDTDSQSLTLAGNVLTISNGNSVTLPSQTLTQTGNTVSLSNNGGSFTLPTFTDNDGQSLALAGNVLSISNGNSVTLPANIPQTLSQTGNTVTLSQGGGSFTLPTQTPQTLSQTGNTITLSNGGGSFTMPTTSVVAGTNVTVTGNGSAATPYQVSSTDKSIYADNGTINAATTISGNRIVYMNNSNLWFNGASSESNGKVYIGSTATYPNTTGNYRLFVEGGILTEKVKVALRSTANWADYVFEKNYDLMPLKNVEEYINTHKHLPGINSAADLSKNGLDLAEMQAKHMAKIEELTLYIIQQNKAIEQNTKDILELKKQIQALTANQD